MPTEDMIKAQAATASPVPAAGEVLSTSQSSMTDSDTAASAEGEGEGAEAEVLPEWATNPKEAKSMVQRLRQEAAKYRRSAAEAQRKLDEAAAEQQKAEERKLAERQEWQKLAEQRAAELDTLKGQLEAERIKNLRQMIGAELGLPTALIARLQGSTEDEIREDAQGLADQLALLKPPATSPAAPAIDSRKPPSTTITPSGNPPVRGDKERREEYYGQGGAGSSPVFKRGTLLINGTEIEGNK